MPLGPPQNPFLRLAPELRQMILSIANDVRASRTCKDFRRATEELIKREWSRFNIGSTPNFREILHPRHFLETGADLNKLYEGVYQKCTAMENPQLAVRAKEATSGSFKPVNFQRLEAAARQAENDWNLKRIWPDIAKKLEIPLHPMTGDQIRASLRENEARFAGIHHLNLSELGLTMIPDEIASLALPNLLVLNLSKNRLKALPHNFGVNWNQIQTLNLQRNQLSTLPDNFGANWNQLQNLYLHQNKLSALLHNFGANWNQLQTLHLYQNQLTTLSDNFGANWNQLQNLYLHQNKLSALPNNFGANWNQIRDLALHKNKLSTLPDNFGVNWNLIETLLFHQNQLTALPDNFGANWNQISLLDLENNQLASLPDNFGVNWNQLEDLPLDQNKLTALPNNFGANWTQLKNLYLKNNQLSALPDNFGANWNQLQSLCLNHNQLSALPDNFGANWFWWKTRRKESALMGNPILNLPPSQPNAITHGLPQNSILDPIPSVPHLEKPSNALMTARFANFAATVALAAVATYAIGWKLPAAIGALYLGHQYMRGDLWAL
jgi:Leucine-rich repeat (LRR) protein